MQRAPFCVANGALVRDGCFREVWIQPAAGDAGGALGAALMAYHGHAGRERRRATGSDGMRGSLLGPEYSNAEIGRALDRAGAVYRRLAGDELVRACVGHLCEDRAVGWFQGRMEFGPRALGARSILADARSPAMQRTLNLKVKYRESFRPFAPAVLAEKAHDWFELEGGSPYMLLTANVAARRLVPGEGDRSLPGLAALGVVRSSIPAVTHVDDSARLQTVDRATNPLFHALLSEFDARTGCPVLVNTSFNVRGEPIVCTPEDAYRCFMGSGIEVLAIGEFLLLKEEQPLSARRDDHHEKFEVD